MRQGILGLVLALALATAADAQLQESNVGSLMSGAGQNGALVGTRFIKPGGLRVCVFEYFITAGTATIELQQRIAGPTGTGRWTQVTGSSFSLDGTKFPITDPLGEYRVNRTAATGATIDVIYECVGTITR